MQACFGSEKLDRQCSRYCYDVVKPLLGQARSWYEQPRENQAITLKELDKRLEEHVEKVEKQVDINNAFTKSFLATLEMNMLEKVESSKNSFKKLETDFQNLNSVLQIQKQYIDSTVDRVENVLKTIDEKLLQQGSGLTVKLETLSNKLDTVLKTQDDQPKVMRKQFEKIGSKYYYISKDMDANWHDAGVLCRKFGGNLVTFESEGEFNAVKSHLRIPNFYWTSLNDADKEGHFVSISTGKEAPYINWHKGEPNNIGRGENCVHVKYMSDRYAMNDRDCFEKIGYICEAGKLETEFQNRLDQNLNDALVKQNREINSALKTLEEKFNQQVDMIQKQIKTNAENVYSRLEPLMGKTENTKTTLDKLEKVMKAVDEKLLKQGKTIESGLTAKLETLNNKIDAALKTQKDQPKFNQKLFEKIGSKYYHISKNHKMNWFEAAAFCRTLGGELVTIESKEEYDAIKSHLVRDSNYWTSLNDLAKEGKYVSIVTGKEQFFTIWQKGEPNNSRGGEDCVELKALANHLFNDSGCKNQIEFICEAGRIH